jgi:hydroxyethylthiazole kinase-like uncharacterized protein yjeF
VCVNKIVSVKQMRAIDAKAVALGLPVYLMMENAGNALARHALCGLGDLCGKKAVVVCGMSNNGGGGLASARHLAYYGADVTVILLGSSAGLKSPDARLQWKTIENMKRIAKLMAEGKKEIDGVKHAILAADCIIDAIFGTGLMGGVIREPASSAIDYINMSNAYVVSNDVPSGVDADTGRALGKSVKPDVVVVLHLKKKGKLPGKAVVESIGIPPDARAR